MLQLTQNINISLEICTTVVGSCVGPSKMSIVHYEICVNVIQLIENVNMSLVIYAILWGIGNRCKSSMGPTWIPIRILHGSYVSTADPKCEYFIDSMCKSVRGSLEDQRWTRIRIMDPYNDPTWIPCGGAAGRPWSLNVSLTGTRAFGWVWAR